MSWYLTGHGLNILLSRLNRMSGSKFNVSIQLEFYQLTLKLTVVSGRTATGARFKEYSRVEVAGRNKSLFHSELQLPVSGLCSGIIYALFGVF